MDGIYLDNAASTPMYFEVIDAMSEWTGFANASSVHKVGIEARKKINESREKFAEVLNCEPAKIIFTSGGTESNAMVMRGFPTARKIATSRYEHESVLANALAASALYNIPLVHIPVTGRGTVDVSWVREMLERDSDIDMVSVMAANNEIGTVNDVKSIASVCREHRTMFHTDCVQAVGCVDLDVSDMGCDFMSLSAHKFHGPKGVGVLYFKDTPPMPLIEGEQEGGYRGGTENVSGIIGAGVAAQIAIFEESAKRAYISLIKRAFCEHVKHRLKWLFDAEKARINCDSDTSAGKIVSMTFDGVDAQTLVLMMSARNAYISAGSACSSHTTQSSHVLKAIGMSDEQAHQTVRISFSTLNTVKEVEEGARILSECVMDLFASQ